MIVVIRTNLSNVTWTWSHAKLRLWLRKLSTVIPLQSNQRIGYISLPPNSRRRSLLRSVPQSQIRHQSGRPFAFHYQPEAKSCKMKQANQKLTILLDPKRAASNGTSRHSISKSLCLDNTALHEEMSRCGASRWQHSDLTAIEIKPKISVFEPDQ